MRAPVGTSASFFEQRRRVLAACAAVVVVCSAPAFLRLFLNDDASYALLGAKLNRGGVMYRDAVDNKPPLIYFTFAAVFRVFGDYNMGAVKALTIAVNVTTAALVMRVGTALFGAGAGALAGLFYAAASVCGIAEDSIAPNTESYMNLFVMLGLAALVRRRPRPAAPDLAAFGAFMAIATMYRLLAVLAMPAAVVYLARSPRAVTGLGRSRGGALVAALAAIAVGFAAPILAIIGYFAARGALADFWSWAITDNFFYVGAAGVHGEWGRKAGLVGLALASQLPLIVLCAAGLLLIPRAADDERRDLWTLVALLAGALFAYQLGGRFYGHYFIQASPFVCLIGAWAFTRAPERFRRLLRPAPLLLGVWCLGFGVINVVRLTRPRLRPGSPEAAAFIRARSGPSDEVLLWGGTPELLVDSGRVFGTRFPNNNAMTGRIWGTVHGRPDATPETNRPFERPRAWELFWQDMTSATPGVILDGTAPHFEIERYPRLASFVAQRYLPPVTFGVLRVYLRR